MDQRKFSKINGKEGSGLWVKWAGATGLFTTVFLSDKDGFKYPQEVSGNG
jgi:hypothetical protein